MKKYKSIIIFAVIAAVVLAVSFMWQGTADNTEVLPQENEVILPAEETPEPELPVEALPEPEVKKEEVSAEPEKAPEPAEVEEEATDSEENLFMLNRGKGDYETGPIPEGKPAPIEPQDVVISDKELTCTLSVRCDAVLLNKDRFNEDKLSVLPPDGVVFAEQTVTFYEGESVFNILLREMKKNKIHFEFEKTPVYNSAYIEGINNIYEFDCGELSGWMYRVNGWFPNYGCSRYQLKDGDRVEILYTCDTGKEFK